MACIEGVYRDLDALHKTALEVQDDNWASSMEFGEQADKLQEIVDLALPNIKLLRGLEKVFGG